MWITVNNLGLGIPVPDYVDENVSDKVVKIIQSYAGVVNKWCGENTNDITKNERYKKDNADKFSCPVYCGFVHSGDAG